MAAPKQPIVFFGTDNFSVPALAGLIKHGFNVAAVVTKPDAPVGRGQSLEQPPIKQLAREHRLLVLQPIKIADIEADLDGLAPSLGVIVAYGKLLPQSTLDRFPHGLVNIHASVLPRYRGASPIEAAILNGDAETGVSLMQLEPGMDTGPVFAQSKLALDGSETRPQLYDQLSQLGASLLTDKLPDILDGSLTPVPQDSQQASHVMLLRKDDGIISWGEPAQVIERQIRAYLGWPGSRSQIASQSVTITGAHVITGSKQAPGTPYATPTGDLAVATAHDDLVIERLRPAGRNEMTGRAWLAGHPIK
jgi:methionyl-tRNA formyltransferase